MKSEQWQQLDNLFHSALEREPEERSAFLDAACGGNESLRQQVEVLIAAHEKSGSFIERPAFEVEAQSVADDQDELAMGQTIGHYKIISTLGVGGMGEVYLAQDTRLGRMIALKLLPVNFTRDLDRVRRFQQEARAASALNHPNIVVIHEVGHVDDRYFIASEFIDGETLRQHIRGHASPAGGNGNPSAGKPLKILDILNIGIQTADALAAAHEAGIVHRDVKPENIMMRRRDGYVKVLDFGLAKLTEDSSVTDPEAPTRAQVKTGAGVVMGTANYMSPEQARGERVDARTDIWGLGVVLYEMVAGCAPFESPTPSEVIALILEREPAPLARYAREVAPELERIVSKALTKNREERYQTAKDLLVDLRRLKQKLEVEGEIERTAAPEVQSPSAAIKPSDEHEVVLKAPGAAARPAVEDSRTISSAEYVVGKIKMHKRGFIVAVSVLILAVSSVGYWLYVKRLEVVNSTAIESIAVLPFVNASQDTNADYLSDGIAESLMDRLSQLTNLKVMSRNMTFRYKGREQDVQKVGKELNVRAVLTGSVKQVGDQIVINVSLDDALDSHHIWGEQYVRKFADILTVQREIAQEVLSSLRLKLTGADEQKRVNKQYTESPEAYLLYLKGRYYWNKRTPELNNKAIEYFQQAVDKDANYALAYAGLGDCYVVPSNPLPPKQKMPKAREAARKALGIDDTLAEAHTTLARVLSVYDWDWPGAEKEFKRAIELDPRSAETHQWYGGYLQAVGQSDESMAERKRAQELEPLSLIMNFEVGQGLYRARKYDQAIEQFNKGLELDPNFPPFFVFLPAAYEQKGMYKDAIAGFQKAIPLTRGHAKSMVLAGLGHVYAVSGKKVEARKVLNELERLAQQEYVTAVATALIYAGLGEKDDAFAWLEKAHEERSFELTWLKVEPRWDNLHSDPRFADLLRRMGLEQ
jgi:serine/threonine protein kinase/TolB-like protein/Tfp pilus assembly protein PilF